MACVEQMLQTVGPYSSTSAASRKLLLTSPVASGLESRVAFWSTILPRPAVQSGLLALPRALLLPPTSLSAHHALARMHPH